MNQVERMFASRSNVISRSAPMRPNSPREIALSEVARNPPSHSEIASKSKVRQTEIFFSIVIAPGSGLFFARERLDLLEPLLQLLVLFPELVDIFAQPLTLFDPAAALADRCDRLVRVALDAAIQIAIGQPAQCGDSARIANLGESGGDAHPHHELAIVGERS